MCSALMLLRMLRKEAGTVIRCSGYVCYLFDALAKVLGVWGHGTRCLSLLLVVPTARRCKRNVHLVWDFRVNHRETQLALTEKILTAIGSEVGMYKSLFIFEVTKSKVIFHKWCLPVKPPGFLIRLNECLEQWFAAMVVSGAPREMVDVMVDPLQGHEGADYIN